MWALGLYKSVVLVLFLLRQNPVQEAAAELFGISQATVSRRWTGLLPVVEKLLNSHVPDPTEVSQGRIVLIDGTLIPTWDWAREGTSMFSGKHRDTGFNLQFERVVLAQVNQGAPSPIDGGLRKLPDGGHLRRNLRPRFSPRTAWGPRVRPDFSPLAPSSPARRRWSG
ncbi:transposase family protein [Streptomyces noursei]|uniref:transposase family protein n=1 Tax=Streptomyces noursei TaxID=1971 RepID=UPI0033D52F6D